MEKINISELLRNCPKGMELDCTMYDKVTLLSVEGNISYPIRVKLKDGNEMGFTKYGQYTKEDFAKCVIFPKGKTTWEGFQRPFKDGDIVATDLGSVFILKSCLEDEIHYHSYIGVTCCNEIQEKQIPFTYKHVCHLATEEEKAKLFDAIKDNGYKWNAETKTLEKLIEPKFNNSEKVDNVNHPPHYTWLKDKCGIEVIDITRHMDFCLGNAIKYILRAGHKQDASLTDNQKEIEDLKKAIWYINDRIKQLGSGV